MRSMDLDRIDKAYEKAYDRLCGVHPDVRCWHFQWLGVRRIYEDMRRILPGIQGRVLDVGCGKKPYSQYLKRVERDRHIGIDVAPGPAVDAVLEEGKRWPFEDSHFDAVLCTQVLEHVPDCEEMISEIFRVLVPGGLLVVTVPFIYSEHGAPRDFRRLSLYGARELFSDRFDVLELKGQGGFGSTAGMLFLGWLNEAIHRSRASRLLRCAFLPAWMAFCLAVNVSGVLLDVLDGTEAFYGNVLLVARRPLLKSVP